MMMMMRLLSPCWFMGLSDYTVIWYGYTTWFIVCHALTHRGNPIKQHISRDDRGLWTVLKLVHKRFCDVDNGGDSWLMTHGSKLSARYRWQIGIKSEDFHEYEQTRVVTTKQHMLACEELAGSTAAVSCQCDSWSTSILNNEYLTNAVWLFMVPMYIGIQMFCFWKC